MMITPELDEPRLGRGVSLMIASAYFRRDAAFAAECRNGGRSQAPSCPSCRSGAS